MGDEEEPVLPKVSKILFLVTSDADKEGEPTGYDLATVAAPMSEFTASEYVVEFASPSGVAIATPSTVTDALSEKYEAAIKVPMEATLALTGETPLDPAAAAGDYEALYVCGGIGALTDLPASAEAIALVDELQAELANCAPA